MKTKIYTIGSADKNKIANLADKLFSERENLIGKIIDWEIFTKDYMKLPLPDNDLDRIYWVNKRPTWIEAINKELLKQELPCRLYITPNLGISVLINGTAAKLTMTKRTKKISNVMNTTIEMVNEMKECFPEASKILDAYSKMTTENLHFFSGRILNSKLPKAIKNELIKIIQKSLPPSED